ncbi:MAG: pyridoxal-phosphate dependent enzyme [Chloroherpetonaceae bacterium]|nr:pyridoxal-phosphate dependent enzyme [Chloroherpetonaceae bacterium]
MTMWHNSILETIGNTPLVRLNRITKGFQSTVLTKIETTNPGGSIKDRIAVSMIEEAEQKGLLKPGATIVEWTAGNTGIGLALVCAVKGYKSIFVMPDKVSQEKIDLLRALGSEVVITPTAVKPEDPRSVYSVVEHLAKTVPNAFYPNQFENPANPRIHSETTGREIWEQTEGKVTHVFAAAGTGGTATGIARFLKSKNPNIKVIAVDPIGSAYREFFKSGKMPAEMGLYKVEGMGGSKIPKTIDFSVLDDVMQVSDLDAFNCGRKLSRMEGIFAGGSSGATLFAALQIAQSLPSSAVVVAMITDSGERYISKMYNDQWMKENNFIQPFASGKSELTAYDILRAKKVADLIYVTPETPLFETFELMKHHEISQVPVISDGAPIGSISEKTILNILLRDESAKNNKVIGYMEKAFPIHAPETLLADLTQELSRETNAVLIGDFASHEFHILTRSDLIAAITA